MALNYCLWRRPRTRLNDWLLALALLATSLGLRVAHSWRAGRVGPHWLLYPTGAACYYLDLRGLQPPATAPDVLALLHRHLVPVQQLRG